jgi:hypothetical protein
MSMVSYWTEVVELYSYDSFTVILGKYNHKNESEDGSFCLGMYWKDADDGIGFPNSRGYLSPIVLDEHFNEGFLQFILFQSVKEKNTKAIDRIKTAIDKLL